MKTLLNKLWDFKFILLAGAIIRILFVFLMGPDHNRLATDSFWIDDLSLRALEGNFNFDDGRFIVAPLYPIFLAFIKNISPENWDNFVSFFQITLSIVSIFWIYKSAKILFYEENVALIASLIFAAFPFSFWWINTYSTESTFQAYLIGCIYFLLKSKESGKITETFFSAVFFSLAFLTKSHILLFSPAIVLIYFFSNQSLSKKIIQSGIFGGFALLSTLPFGLYNLNHNNTYVLASNGASYHFYTGNSPYGYASIVDVPEPGTPGFKACKNMDFDFFHGEEHEQMIAQRVDEKQSLFVSYSFNWIKENMSKFWELKVYNLFFFLFPGVSFRHYPFMQWLFSFAMSLPVYAMAYYGIYKALKCNFKKHFWILGLLGTMLLFSVIWYVQNRFRTITLEPFYFMYAGFAIYSIIEKKLPGLIKKTN